MPYMPLKKLTDEPYKELKNLLLVKNPYDEKWGLLEGKEGYMEFLASSLENQDYAFKDVTSDDLPRYGEDLGKAQVIWIMCCQAADITLPEESARLVKRQLLKRNAGLLITFGGVDFDDLGETEWGKLSSTFGIKNMTHDGIEKSSNRINWLYHPEEVSWHVERHPATESLRRIGATFKPERYECLYPLDINEDMARSLVSISDIKGHYGSFPVFAINRNYRVAALSSELNIFSDEIIQRRDNLRFATNLFRWLCGT